MRTFKLKSTIKCSGCIQTVKPVLDGEEGINTWKVDLNHPDRLLTIQSDTMQPNQIIEALKTVGHSGELVSSN